MLREFIIKAARIAWFLPGFLLWAAFPPMAETLDGAFALVPLIWLSRQGDCRKSALRWFQSGIFFWTATLSWLPAIVKNGGPWPLVVLGWGALVLYCSLYFAAYGWLSASYWRWAGDRARWHLRILGFLFVEPVLWCGLELVRSNLFSGFAWNHLGVLPANAGFGAPAGIGGVYLLSAVVIIVNGIFAGIVERIVLMFKRRKVDRFRSVETVVGLLAVVFIYWAADRLKPPPPEFPRHIKTAMVQRNFPCCFKDQDENPAARYDELLSNILPLDPELIVLPESAMSEFGAIDGASANIFAKRIIRSSKNAHLLAGGARRTASNEYNSAALYSFTEEGRMSVQIYDKNHLVPFGEYIPGDKTFPALQRFAPVGSCTAGEPKLLYLKDGTPFAVAICFEDTDSGLVRKFARMGARFLVFITNDSWFSYSNEARQHSWQASVRAYETSLPVVRVGNNGVTGVVFPDGRASWACDADLNPLVDKPCTMFDRIVVAGAGEPARQTWYVKLGDVPLILLFVLLLCTMILVKYYISYEKRRNMSL